MNRPDAVDTVDPSTGEITATAGGMMASAGNIPAEISANMDIGLQCLFNDDLYQRCKQVANIMANAKGVSPPNLIGNPELCFTIVTLALRTKMDPFALAAGSYQTPGGQIGYMTRIVQSVVEASGIMKRSPERIYTGPWEDKIDGKYQMVGNGDDKKKRPEKTWTREDARGCKLKLVFHFKDQDEPEEFEMDLSQIGTMFSTQWDSETRTQFYNLVYRRAINQLRPSVLAGVQHGDDLRDNEHAREMKDITPKTAQGADSGLDDFASEEAPTGETIVDPEPPAETGTPKKSDEASKAKAAEKRKSSTPDQKATVEPEKLLLWISADEPARPMKTMSNAVFVLRTEIRGAKTPALAKTVFDQNMELLAKAGKQAQDDIEAELNRRFEKDNKDGDGQLI